MVQRSLFQPETPDTHSVGELTRRVRQLLEGDPILADVWVAGEISNVSNPRSGHLYFTLKDSDASLRCVMWKPQVQRLRFLPQVGDAVEVHGRIGVYEPGGQYQLYADRIAQTGQGALFQEYLRLKDRLEGEGLFDPERKRPLPRWPARIGLVTSPTGAALQDILNTFRRRFPLAEVVLAPTAVQGIDAPAGIILIVGRGGGSLEDLWAFNDEGVVRAVAASPIPIISGVGHETDFTLTDFAADLRAPTPTAAAELATPDQNELRQSNDERGAALEQALRQTLAGRLQENRLLEAQLRRYSPQEKLRRARQRSADLAQRLRTTLLYRVEVLSARLAGSRSHLESLDPRRILERGYAVVTGAGGQPVSSIAHANKDDPLRVQLKDGALLATVDGKEQT